MGDFIPQTKHFLETEIVVSSSNDPVRFFEVYKVMYSERKTPMTKKRDMIAQKLDEPLCSGYHVCPNTGKLIFHTKTFINGIYGTIPVIDKFTDKPVLEREGMIF